MSPTHWNLARWRHGTVRKGSDGGGNQLPLSFERSIIASVSAGQQVRKKEYYE